MKHEIIVPIITPITQKLVSHMNGSVRMINLMIDQLYAQHEKIEELKQEKIDYPAIREKRVRVINERQERYELQCEKIENLEKEIKNLRVIDIRKRIKLVSELKQERDKLDSMKASLLQSNYILNKKDDYYAHIDVEIETVLLPNYKQHLEKFYQAVRSYRKLAHQLQSVTGVEVPDIEVDKIILFNGNRGEFPVVNIDIVVPTLELELDYDRIDDFDNENIIL